MGAIRLFLALVVAADHLTLFVLGNWNLGLPWRYRLGMNAGYAVMFFYVISGFLISLVLDRKYPPSIRGTAEFYHSRLIRIFSLYWPVAAIAFVWLGHGSPAFGIDNLTAFFPFFLDWVICFAAYPDMHFESALPGLAQAWTLGAELTFYAVAPWLLRHPRLVGIVFLLSVLTRVWCVAYVAAGYDPRWVYMFAPSTFLFFLLGHFAYAAAGRWQWLERRVVARLLLIACAAFLMLPKYTTWDSFRFWCAVLCFAAALPGVFQATRNSRILNRLGDLSYPIYLVHMLVLLALADTGLFPWLLAHLHASRTVQGTVLTVVFLLIVTAVGWLAHWGLEKPVAWAMEQATERLRFGMAMRRASAGIGPAP